MKKILYPRIKTQITRNTTIVGDSIEVMIEKLRAGEGEDAIEDRDLVYNDNETAIVNPITNMRSDKFDLMLEEKMGENEYNHKPAPTGDIQNEGEEQGKEE